MALPVALWLAALVAVIGAGALMIAAADLRFGISATDRAQARHWAEGVASLAALRLAEADPLYRRALASGEPLELRRPEGVAIISLSAEEDRLDLNSAAPAQIAALLEEIGYERGSAAAAGSAIADFRDADDLERLGGAEARSYVAAGLAHAPLNRMFLSFEEVDLVLGVDREMKEALRSRATVWGDRPGAVRVEDLQALRVGRSGSQPLLFWGGALTQGAPEEGDSVGGAAFRIDVSARAASGAEERVVWVVLVDRGLAPPFRVLDRF